MKNTTAYLPQIDTLRFFAALGVINLHWVNVYFEGSFDWSLGKYGVQLFFVLSGFLITKILLAQKESPTQKMTLVKRFFMRRVLRLFPIYYLLLIFLILIKDQYVIDNALSFFSYTANFSFAQDGLVDKWSNHVWTLCIEEQFYLIFPWLILFTPRKWELPTLGILFGIGVLFKILIVLLQRPNWYFLMFSQLDMLAAGALLGLFWHRNSSYLDRLTQTSTYLIPVFGLLTIALHYTTAHESYLRMTFTLSLLIFCVLLVHKTALGFKGKASRLIFDNAILQYLGKVSYGLYLYLYHKVIPLTLFIVLPKLGIQNNNFYFLYLLSFAILLIVSIASWQWIEKPILKLKKHFSYNKG